MNAGIVATFQKAITGETRDLVDPYVQVSFAGLTVSKYFVVDSYVSWYKLSVLYQIENYYSKFH